jgi:hypothetical protein
MGGYPGRAFFERLKNEIDVKKALRHAERKGRASNNMDVAALLEVQEPASLAVVTGTGVETEWEDVGIPSPA